MFTKWAKEDMRETNSMFQHTVSDWYFFKAMTIWLLTQILLALFVWIRSKEPLVMLIWSCDNKSRLDVIENS